MRLAIATLVVTLGILSASTNAWAQANRNLRIYVIDVEGGGATLYVGPTGESLLIDTGNGDAAASPNASRIMAAVEDAGLKQILSTPGLEDLWQVHFSQLSGQEYTVPGAFISNRFDQEETSIPRAAIVRDAVNANLFKDDQGREAPAAPVHDGPSFFFKVTAQEDGTFTVTNTRNGFSKTYPGKK